MKRNLQLIATLILVLSACFLSNAAFAQEAQNPAVEAEPAEDLTQPADETEFSYGTVKSVSDNQIVVSEYDYDSDKDVDVTYTVPADAILENVASLKDIAVGDAVDIDFLVKDGQKVASLITVEKPGAEDEDLALDIDEPKPGDEPVTS